MTERLLNYSAFNGQITYEPIRFKSKNFGFKAMSTDFFEFLLHNTN